MAINRVKKATTSRLPRRPSERLPLYSKDLADLCGCYDATGVTISGPGDTLITVTDKSVKPSSIIILTVENSVTGGVIVPTLNAVRKGSFIVDLHNAGLTNITATDKLKLNYIVFNN